MQRNTERNTERNAGRNADRNADRNAQHNSTCPEMDRTRRDAYSACRGTDSTFRGTREMRRGIREMRLGIRRMRRGIGRMRRGIQQHARREHAAIVLRLFFVRSSRCPFLVLRCVLRPSFFVLRSTGEANHAFTH